MQEGLHAKGMSDPACDVARCTAVHQCTGQRDEAAVHANVGTYKSMCKNSMHVEANALGQ